MDLIVNRERLIAEYPTCYACDERRRSVEHVPPKCFFPDEKDANGNLPYRKQLITVPACDDHNLRRSKDDFYAAFHLTSTIPWQSLRQAYSRGHDQACNRARPAGTGQRAGRASSCSDV